MHQLADGRWLRAQHKIRAYGGKFPRSKSDPFPGIRSKRYRLEALLTTEGPEADSPAQADAVYDPNTETQQLQTETQEQSGISLTDSGAQDMESQQGSSGPVLQLCVRRSRRAAIWRSISQMKMLRKRCFGALSVSVLKSERRALPQAGLRVASAMVAPLW